MARLTLLMTQPLSQPALPETTSLRAMAARAMRELAVHDVIVVTYQVLVFLAALQGSGPLRQRSLAESGALLAFTAMGIFAHRSGAIRGAFAGPMLYRVSVYGGVQLSYFALRNVLPTAAPWSFDEQLYRLDVALFGAEPTLVLDRFVTPQTTEWFSFFYFNYFFLLAVHVLPFLFLSRRLALFSEFALAILTLFCISHLLYMAVPGYGPYKHLADLYQHELPSGTWYDVVISAVQSGGAQKDIFPSLHTGAPTLVTLFSIRHRKELPFKYTWPLVAFFTVNIIGATLFLRWHYLIDVVAGLLISSTCVMLAPRIRAWEDERRAREGLGLVWPALLGRYADELPPRSARPRI